MRSIQNYGENSLPVSSCLTHIYANSGSSVSIMPISAVNPASHSYRSQLGHFVVVILGTSYISDRSYPDKHDHYSFVSL